ncbi:ATP-binding protein [Sphaerisporangium sp. NPDC049003]|uniref:ATP-binding protein n=1 Tax=Sphaerisporangium sp. NPDC049003 TaxID=3364517 RepID=UPI00371168A5
MSEHEAHWDLPANPEAIGKGREIALATLESWGLGDLAYEVLVILSELCTNAITYGCPPYTMSLRSSGRCVGGEVADMGPVSVPAPRTPGDDEEHGRGLVIVAALADRWGVEPADDGRGKTVWFTRCM